MSSLSKAEGSDEAFREAAQRAWREWHAGPARLDLVSRSENVVSRVETAAAESYVLRIHRPGYHDLEELVSEQQLIESARTKVRAVLSRYEKKADGYGLIHADLHPGNVLFDGSRLHPIDFDDAGFGWHVYDLAVALFYYQSRRDFDSILQALVSGYRAHRPLSDEALERLPLFLLIRALVLLGWIDGRTELDRSEFFEHCSNLALHQAESVLG